MIEELNPVQIAILTLARAKDVKGNTYSPISGKTHLIKELFVIKKTPLGSKLLKDLSFEPDNYGPFDETIYSALDDLISAGIVGIEGTGSSQKIKLTQRGKELIDSIWDKFSDDVVSLFTYVKVNYNSLKTDDLLDRIYSAYPDMVKYSKSKVAEKYR